MSPERGTPNGAVPGDDRPAEGPAPSPIRGAGGVWRGTRWSPTASASGEAPAGGFGTEPVTASRPRGADPGAGAGEHRIPAPLTAPAVPPADGAPGGAPRGGDTADRTGGDRTADVGSSLASETSGGETAGETTAGNTDGGGTGGPDASGSPRRNGRNDDDPAGWDDEGLGDRIRPYALTGGRTRSSDDLPLETLVVRTSAGSAAMPATVRERHRILDLCGRPLSIAEISAYVGIHLGVARVLVGDMKGEGLLDVHRPRAAGDRPDIKLLERVLDGLQAL